MSSQYKALTRKYRPADFDDIVAQSHVSDTLKNAIEASRLSHAYLFCGPRGVGKTTMARALARRLNDIGREIDGEALNQTLNIIEVDAASNNKVEDAHRIREAVRVPPQTGRYKIFIIDEVHMLSKAAFNALLKTLEEPPAYAIFIFATTEPHKVLPTILSRVQRFDFRPITVPQIVEHLGDICEKESITIDDESLHFIARKAEGALRDALGLLDQIIALCGTEIQYEEVLQAFNAIGLELLFELTEHISEQHTVAGVELVSRVLQQGHDIQEFLMALTEHLRNLLMAHDKRNMHAIESSKEVRKKLHEAAQAFTEDDLMRMLHIVHDAQFKVRDAHQPRILLEMTVLKLIKMERTSSLQTLMGELQALRKAVAEGGGALAASQDGTAGYRENATGEKKNAEPGLNAPQKEKNDRTAPESGLETPPAADTAPEPEPEPAPKPSVNAEPSPNGQASGNGLNLGGVSVRKPRAGSKSKPKAVSAGGGAAVARKPAAKSANPDAPEPEKAPADSRGGLQLHEVKALWTRFVSELPDTFPITLRMAIDSVGPAEVRGKLVIMRCSDTFVADLVQENITELSKLFSSFSGVDAITLRTQVQDNEEEEAARVAASDPYAQFKKLQEKDPRIKTIVDVFGAELDY